MENKEGTLAESEYHPAADIALDYIRTHLLDSPMLIESLCSVALSDNRLAKIAWETFRRLQDKEPVSDRYLMGLAWMVWAIENVK